MSIGLGDVVYCEGYSDKMVIVDMDNYEEIGACAYDRIYYLMDLAKIAKLAEQGELMELRNISVYSTKKEVRGVTKLPLTLVENEAPFEFTPYNTYKIRRKKAKTVTIYE